MTIERLRFQNGMTLLAKATCEAPVVALQAWVKVGSADEDKSLAGIAHLHEHMLFKGTAARRVGEIARSIEAAGGEINAWTSYDQTVYHIVLANSELDLGLDVLADALRNSSFDADELAREIEVVIEEINRAEDVPARRISNALFALAYGDHSYGRPVLGQKNTVRAISRDILCSFFNSHYQPKNTTLVAVGDFDINDLKTRVHHFFSDWQAKAKTAILTHKKEMTSDKVRVQVLREDVKETRISLAWHIPGLKHQDTAALDILAVLLGQGESSRLFVETRRRQELVNDVYAYAYTPRDPGLMILGANLRQENIMAALTSILDEAFRLREHLVGEDELDKAKVVVTSETAYQRETVQGEARRLGYFEVVAGDYDYETRYRQTIADLTCTQVQTIARRYLTTYPAIIVQVPQNDDQPYEEMVESLVDERYRRAERHRRTLEKNIDVERIELDNKTVLLVRQTNAPIAAIRAVALGGLRYETKATVGVGALFSSIWGLASEDLGAEAMARRVAVLGGNLGAFSGRNTVGLRGEFIAEKAIEGLQLFCDNLLHPVFHASDLERERALLLERFNTRDDNPATVAFELFAQTLFPNHPYGLRLGGTEDSLASFTLNDMTTLKRRYLSADKLVVAVVGGIDRARTIDLLSRELEEGEGETLPADPAIDTPPKQMRQAQYMLEKQQAHIIVGSMGTTVYCEDRFALEVLTTILSGQGGRLFYDLRDRQSLAYAVSSSSIEGIDPGYVYIYIGTSPDKVKQALAGLYNHLDHLRQTPVTAIELERAQRYLIGTHAIDLQRAGARAMFNALGERFGQGYDDYRHYPEHIAKITVADVQRVAQSYLAPQRLVQVIVGP
ncbi:MAG: insulinase family protein [Deltaproteobacteria bacterium]|nr:insulinase family protein [Deltaproteobacteria bacterium]